MSSCSSDARLQSIVIISQSVWLQLYLNYRLKSVAHLPWRQMSYK